MTALCVLIGLVAGFGAAGFFTMLEAAHAFCMGTIAHYHPATPENEKPMFGPRPEETRGIPIRRWALLFLPAVGGLVSGFIVYKLAPEAEGHGTDAAIEAYHFKDGKVRGRVPIVKAIASAITIGTGGSAGREGPIAQIGSGFGSVLGQWVRVSRHERRVLMVAGMAAGIGAIFHAPLAGALFAAEVLYRDPDFEHEVLVPGFISSIIAYCVFGSIFGFHPLFLTPNYDFQHAGLLAPYLILAIVASAGAFLYTRSFYGFRGLMFKRVTVRNYFKPAIGGVLVGIVGFFLPEALGAGYGVLQKCFQPAAGSSIENARAFSESILSLPSAAGLAGLLPDGFGTIGAAALLLAVIALAKIATTAFSVGSGGSGGVFGPAIVIGGALGGATGLVCTWLFPSMNIAPGAFALVGMAGFFAGAANTPVSTIIMVSEMTGNYKLLLPSMFVCIVAYVLCHRCTLYEKQLKSRLDAPSKLGNMASAILRRLNVAQALEMHDNEKLVVVPRNLGLGDLMERFAHSGQACFPTVDDDNRLKGVIESRDIRRIVTEVGMVDLIIARDIEVPAITVTPDASLLVAINLLVKTDREELVVVDPQDEKKVIGTLNRGDVVACYNRQIVASRDTLTSLVG